MIVLLTVTGGPPPEEADAQRFVAAWSKGDFATMHAELTPDDQRAMPLARFTEGYRAAATTPTGPGRNAVAVAVVAAAR